jgi:16S rRNA (cytosine967-C5)-methyltransferase
MTSNKNINNKNKNNHSKNNIPAHSVDTRELALEMLIEINERGAFSHIVLRSVLDKYQYLSKQDRAFMTRLVDGTIEYMLQLDYIIDSFSKTKVRKMKPFIRNLLRMSVYQIKYMDAVPDSAVCNEAVKLAKRHKFAQLSGFVNGVLRNIARNIDSVQLDTLSIRYSMPQWIVDRFVAAYTEEIFKAFHNKSTISIRTNLTRCTPDELRAMLEAEGVTVTAVDELNYAFVISGFDYLNGLQSFRDGLFYVQDISSMLVAQTAAPKKGDYVIDVCAAPGGKSTHIAELLQGSGHVLARDLTDNKVDMIEENIERHGLNNMSAEVWDATVPDADSAGKADILICDLPCSGLGVLGRKKDIRYKMTPESVDELAALQRQILDTVHTYVKPNGVLVYSTCTIDEAENENNVRWFIEKYPEFELDKSFAEGTGMKQILPGEHGSDGFFIARFIKSKL